MTGPHSAIAATRVAVRGSLGQIAEASPGALVLAACSGGADSLALAAAVAFEAPRTGLSAGAVIVDHDLQEGSRAVAERAAGQCRRLGLDPVEIVTVQVALSASARASASAGTDGANGTDGTDGTNGTHDSSGGGNRSGSGPEARAREARYGAFEDVIRRVGAVAVMLGHTRDDQAEQVLLGLARGSGARSLSGMPARRGRYVRPFLGVPRSTTVAACNAAGLRVWVDPHNSDPAYGRVRARRVLPLLESELGPGTVAALARSADLLREDADALDDIAARALADLGGEAGIEPGGSDDEQPGRASSAGAKSATRPGRHIEATALLSLPTAVRTRVWRLLAIEAGCPPGALISTHIDSLDTLVTGWRGQGPIDLPGHVQGTRTDGRVLVSPVRRVQ